MSRRHTLRTTAARLMLAVQERNNIADYPVPTFRMWAAWGGPAFMWRDSTGHFIAGYEEADRYGRTVCKIYYGMGITDPEALANFHPRRVVRDLCPECGDWSYNGDTTVCPQCRGVAEHNQSET